MAGGTGSKQTTWFLPSLFSSLLKDVVQAATRLPDTCKESQCVQPVLNFAFCKNRIEAMRLYITLSLFFPLLVKMLHTYTQVTCVYVCRHGVE